MKKGNTAEVFDYDTEKVCKFFYQRIPYEYVQQEYTNAKKLMEMGIRVPEPFKIVEQEGRYGIIYEKIPGVVMRECMNKEHIFEKFIEVHKKLLDISTDVLMPYREFLFAMVRGNGGEVSKDMREEIGNLPDGNFVLHGDYHPGNVIVTAGGELVIIDLLNACCGPKEYDVARTFFLLEDEGMGNMYLEGLGYCKEQIGKYLKIIGKMRKFE